MNPVTLAARIDTRWLLVVLITALDMWSAGLVLRSRASRRERLLWAAVIVLCPIIGLMIWFVLGPKPMLVPGRDGGDGSWPRRQDDDADD
ncbi:MAG: PLD nuclease N-terminal domain-containing protein [Candidatus Palauibacterales bacterium]|nr:PLD nuclease N-terminal domain-containing protein [Candidatus Palauibacterales bacterium]MDP2530647.1 PLD nuclease N-terminal domain-containing protein [Candidatus Palauibacterales bacterium]MDP2583554.1 PLD nuclease N-terminal domain-containing protein [Candidatus Palauibacterales bacterium]